MEPMPKPLPENPTEQQVARSALIVGIGNVLSRATGLVRDTAIAGVFGAGGAVSAYVIARQVPLQLHAMLIDGLVSSALVPTFSEYAERRRRDELWHIASLLSTAAALALAVIVLLLVLAAPLLTPALAGFDDDALQSLTMRLLRIVVPAVFFMGLSGLATALCHALRRFTLPAFAGAVFNTSIVVFALVFGPRWRDVRVLAAGLVVGAALQVVVQIPALRDMRFRPVLDLRHPVLRQVLRLYSPVVLSLAVAALGVLIDRNLASRTGASSPAWMALATTLRETPLGLVSFAVSTAILPTLSAIAAREQENGALDGRSVRFRSTLARGLGLVLVLTLPAAVGLFVLAQPLVALLFQHGQFGAHSTAQTALALRFYLFGMVFAAVDLPLVFAFYARKDTWRPALVGVLSVVVYLLVALPTYRPLGMVGLILADNLKLAAHAAVMAWLFWQRVGTLGGHGLGATLLKSLLASSAMALAMYGAMVGTGRLLPGEGKIAWAATVVLGGLVGLGAYVAACWLLRVRELQVVRSLVVHLIGRGPVSE